MKRSYLLAAFVSFVALVLAIGVQAGSEPRVLTVPAGETVEGNFYGAGDSVQVNGTVASDVIVAGGNVTVTGDVGGDVLVAGGDVRITGTVGGSIRVVGGTVLIDGAVGRNVTVAAGKLTFGPASTVGGHVTVAAGEFDLAGGIDGSLTAAAGKVTLSGEVQGPIRLWLDRAGSLSILGTAVTGSTFSYVGSGTASVASGAKLSQAPVRSSYPVRSERHRFGWMWFLASLFGSLVTVMVLAVLLPKSLTAVADEALARPLVNLGWGGVWGIVAPVAMVALSIVIISLPVAFLLGLMYVAGFLLAPAFVGAAVGRFTQVRLGEAARSYPLLAVVIFGTLLFRLAAALPLIGWLVSLLGTLLVWGAVLVVLRRSFTPSR